MASLRRRFRPIVQLARRRPWLKARTGQLDISFELASRPSIPELLERLETAPDVIVVVPVYNGGEVVARCLEAVIRNTPGRRIVVLDDGSTDPGTLALLAEFERAGSVEVIANECNLGYTRTVNRAIGIQESADLVLLNSDTQVGPLWLERLRAVAYSVPRAAGASAFSDNAGSYALPVSGQSNQWPRDEGWTRIARYVLQHANSWSLSAPTLHGFCVYLRREALNEIGPFDQKMFPRGYGEENEWSMRAIGAGFVCLGAPGVFVGHEQGASFGRSRMRLIHRARILIDEVHPSFGRLVDQWWNHTPGFDVVRQNSESMRAALVEGAQPQPCELMIEPGATDAEVDEAEFAEQLLTNAVERVRVFGELAASHERACGLLGIPVERLERQ